MSPKHMLAAFTLLVSLVVRSPIAFAQEITEEDEGDYEYVIKDRLTPFTGYLFTSEGLIKLMAKCDARIDKAVLEKEKEIAKKAIELEAELKKKEKEIEINKEMYEELLKVRQARIDGLVADAQWNKFYIAGGFVGGIALTVGVVYLAGQALK